jgi:hypothetical protein
MALGTALREHELVALDMRDVYDDDGSPRRRVALRTFKPSTPTALQATRRLSEAANSLLLAGA